MPRIPDSLAALARPVELPQVGDYVTDGRELYCVEEVLGDHALIEDCRCGVLIDVSLDKLRDLELVRSARYPRAEA